MAEAESVRRGGENSSLPTHLGSEKTSRHPPINSRADRGIGSLSLKRGLEDREFQRACSDRRTRSRNGTPWNP